MRSERIERIGCIGCDNWLQVPFLQFLVQPIERGDESELTKDDWKQVIVCRHCAGKLTAEDLHRLVDMPDEEAEAAHG